MEANYYAWNDAKMRHLSVGAVVENEEGKILCLRLEREGGRHFLPAKTHRPNQTLEKTLTAISGETGWEVEIVDFLGSTATQFPIPGEKNVSKTTLWFHCRPLLEVKRDPDDRDRDAEVHWLDRVELSQIFASQAVISTDVDQRSVLNMLP